MEAAALSASRRRTRVTSDANRYPAAETPARSVSVPDARRSLRLSSITKPDGIETQDPDLSQDLLNDTGVSPAPARELRFSPSRPRSPLTVPLRLAAATMTTRTTRMMAMIPERKRGCL